MIRHVNNMIVLNPIIQILVSTDSQLVLALEVDAAKDGASCPEMAIVSASKDKEKNNEILNENKLNKGKTEVCPHSRYDPKDKH